MERSAHPLARDGGPGAGEARGSGRERDDVTGDDAGGAVGARGVLIHEAHAAGVADHVAARAQAHGLDGLGQQAGAGAADETGRCVYEYAK